MLMNSRMIMNSRIMTNSRMMLNSRIMTNSRMMTKVCWRSRFPHCLVSSLIGHKLAHKIIIIFVWGRWCNPNKQASYIFTTIWFVLKINAFPALLGRKCEAAIGWMGRNVSNKVFAGIRPGAPAVVHQCANAKLVQWYQSRSTSAKLQSLRRSTSAQCVHVAVEFAFDRTSWDFIPKYQIVILLNIC